MSFAITTIKIAAVKKVINSEKPIHLANEVIVTGIAILASITIQIVVTVYTHILIKKEADDLNKIAFFKYKA